eukprot:1998260-Rhodomonas_salina.2
MPRGLSLTPSRLRTGFCRRRCAPSTPASRTAAAAPVPHTSPQRPYESPMLVASPGFLPTNLRYLLANPVYLSASICDFLAELGGDAACVCVWDEQGGRGRTGGRATTRTRAASGTW